MRLIDADVLAQHVNKKFYEHYGNTKNQAMYDFCRFLLKQTRKAPTIDAVEVVHGQWENGNGTNCGQVDFSKPNYCPNCGAKMDGDMTQTLLRKLEDT